MNVMTRSALAGLTCVALGVSVGCGPPQPPGPPVFTEGVYRVGIDILPGVYVSTENNGVIESAARLDAAQNELSAETSDRVVIEVKATDAFLDLVGSFRGYQPRPITPPPPTGRPVNGTYIVNAEIAPGTYLLQGPDLYWARLGDINGDVVIDFDQGSGQLVLTVEPSDFSIYMFGTLLPG